MNEQEKRERVIRGLEEVVHDFHEEVDEWGCYTPDELRGGTTVDCDWFYGVLEKCEDALALLKAQEPRVMTAEEVASLTTDICKWLWIEEAQRVTWNMHCVRAFVYSRHPDTGGFYIMENAWHDVVKLEGDEYGKTWRCWTSCPTDAQRAAEPWKEANPHA